MINETNGRCKACGKTVYAGEGIGHFREGCKVTGGVTPVTTGYGSSAGMEYAEAYARLWSEDVYCIGCVSAYELARHQAEEAEYDAMVAAM